MLSEQEESRKKELFHRVGKRYITGEECKELHMLLQRDDAFMVIDDGIKDLIIMGLACLSYGAMPLRDIMEKSIGINNEKEDACELAKLHSEKMPCPGIKLHELQDVFAMIVMCDRENELYHETPICGGSTDSDVSNIIECLHNNSINKLNNSIKYLVKLGLSVVAPCDILDIN